jgi:hypothetical protein
MALRVGVGLLGSAVSLADPPVALPRPALRLAPFKFHCVVSKKSPSMTQAGDENSSGLPCHAERVCDCRQ